MAKPEFYNEMYRTDGSVRAHYGACADWLKDKPVEYLLQKQREADTLYTRLGITFAVYGDETGVERAIPFDIIPRIFDATTWSKIHDGACQRVRALNAFLRDVYHEQDIVRANQRLRRDIAYVNRAEHGVQPCEDTLRERRGSCRDAAWLLVQILRHLGFAPRFVSGYLIQLANANPDGPRTDQADLHAWCEVFVPGAGWIGLDPTSGLLASEGHIPLARSSSGELAAAISGSVEPCVAHLEVSMPVRRLERAAS